MDGPKKFANLPPIEAYAVSVDSAEISWDAVICIRSDDDAPNGFLFPRSAAIHSPFLSQFVDMGDDQLVIPVLRFQDHILGMVAIYLNHFCGIEGEGTDDADSGRRPPVPTQLPKPFPYDTVRPHVSDFEAEFFEQFLEHSIENVVGVLNVCNYLQVVPLLELAALALAQRFKGKTPEEIKAIFDGVQLPVRAPARE